MIDTKKYLLTFFITAAIFGAAVFTANYFQNKRLIEMQDISNNIANDISSNEIQFDLLSELSCRDVGSEKLSQEINEMWQKIEFIESQVGSGSPEVTQLKKQYAILQVKDYILMKRISDRCKKEIMFAFYFYGNEKNCETCKKTGETLTELKLSYPQLRIYSFDYALDLSIIRTIISIFNVNEPLPVIIVWDEVANGYQNMVQLESLLKKAYPDTMATIEAEKQAKEKAEQIQIEEEVKEE